ncbi:hypothetical protein BKA61DRAFT_705515 [Leptodontidium sp. MPI-SDFR-AT-0119]|nr:hypothetical protein BKA61DRAFT_705515 [Leptodontidium sp. MPI-SDFR-AT-0119]
MSSMQKCLVEIVMTLLGSTIEEEFRWRNAVINTVAAYCHFQESSIITMPREKRSTQTQRSTTQLTTANTKKQALSATTLLVFKEKRPTVCFICLRKKSLLFEKRIYSIATPGDLTKHFKRKHLANIRRGD